MTTNGNRFDAWKDTLSQDELEMVERISSMPPQMAIGYVYVKLKDDIEEVRKPLWKQVAAPMGAAFAVAIAYLDPNLPRLH